MISSETEYIDAMRSMILKVQKGYEPPFSASAEEFEIFADCIRKGYLLGKTTYVNANGQESELRTLDGKMHPELINHVITLKGLAFLSQQEQSFENQSLDDASKPSVCPDSEETNQIVNRVRNPINRIIGFAVALIGFIASVITIYQFCPNISRLFS